jgi:hypothetical protein
MSETISLGSRKHEKRCQSISLFLCLMVPADLEKVLKSLKFQSCIFKALKVVNFTILEGKVLKRFSVSFTSRQLQKSFVC